MQIVDARTAGEYLGNDVRAIRGGHIPGAVNIPYEQNWKDPDTTNKLARRLVTDNSGAGLTSADNLKALYAKLDKLERKKNMDDFRAGRTTVLVTSDLAARGLDIPNVTHIIQLDVNENEDFFIHRAGRTARAGKSGINVIFGDERELRNLARIEKKLGIVVYPKVLYGGKVSEPEQFDDDGEDPAETER